MPQEWKQNDSLLILVFENQWTISELVERPKWLLQNGLMYVLFEIGPSKLFLINLCPCLFIPFFSSLNEKRGTIWWHKKVAWSCSTISAGSCHFQQRSSFSIVVKKDAKWCQLLGHLVRHFPIGWQLSTSSDWLVHFNGEWRRHSPFKLLPHRLFNALFSKRHVLNEQFWKVAQLLNNSLKNIENLRGNLTSGGVFKEAKPLLVVVEKWPLTASAAKAEPLPH